MPEQLERYEQKPLSEQTKQNLMDQLTLADHLVYKKYLPDLQNYALVDPTEQMVGGKITDDYMKVFKLEELTVKQGEDQLQKLSTVYHSSMALGCSLAVLVSVKKSGAPASIYLGVRRNLRQKNSEAIENLDISFKTLHEGMKSNFPGSQTSRIYASDDQQDTESLNYLLDGAFGDKMRTITSASCVAALRDKSKTENKAFIQGIERFMDAMGDHVYTALFLADPVSENDQASIRSSYEQLYSTLVMRELLSEKEESELPKEVLEHWWKHWQNRIDTTTGEYLCEVLENQNDKCDEVIQKAVYDIFEGKQLFSWYGNKMESRTDAYGELIERLCGRYRLSEKIAKEILDCIMTTGLEEAKNKEGVEAIRKKYNEQRSEQV